MTTNISPGPGPGLTERGERTSPASHRELFIKNIQNARFQYHLDKEFTRISIDTNRFSVIIKNQDVSRKELRRIF